LADHFPHGALWVPLAAVNQIDAIPALIAEAMGAALRGAASPASQLRALLADCTLLLVLDNFEHLLDVNLADRAVDLIEQLLMQAPGVRLLVTSRERLRLNVERIFEVDGLTAPRLKWIASLSPEEAAAFDAVILFLERARQVDRQFALNATNSLDVARVCALLQGMPLGIELAASWVRMLTPREIAAEIASSIDFLALSDRKTTARHRSIRAVFDQSWELLEPDERRGLAHLAILRGSFDRVAAQTVADVALPMLAALVDKSLVRVASDSAAGAAASRRYDLHELLRRYLLDKLAESGEQHAIEARRFQYYLDVARRGAPLLLQDEASARAARLEPEQGNLRASLEWTLEQGNDVNAGVRLAALMGRFWYHTEQWREGREWLLKAAQSEGGDDLARAFVFTHLGLLCHSLSDHAASADSFQRAIALWRQLDRPEELAWTLVQAGSLSNTMGDFDAAAACFDEALAHYRQTNNEVRVAVVLSHSASAAISLSRYEEAARLAGECLALFRRLNRQENLVIALNLLGRALLGLGETDQPIVLFMEALEVSQQRGSNAGVMWASLNLGLTYALQGDFVAAGLHYGRALDGYVSLGKRGGILAVLDGLAAVCAGSGAPGEAVELMAATELLRREISEQLTPQEQTMRQRAIEQSKAQLDEVSWHAAWQRGCNLSLERAVSLVRAVMNDLDAEKAPS
ncbi:MAG: tetratricopeptide repeat protein, partial [Caldilinea sp.]